MKRDLKDAFRYISIALSDQWLLGFFCDCFYWVERYLSFGLRTSSFIFDLFVKGVNWCLVSVLYWIVVFYYLDDFFVIFASNVDAGLYSR